jgi:outer membrane protein
LHVKLRSAVALTVFVLAAGSAIPARAAAPLDLHAAVRYALDHDPAVLQHRATVAQNEATYAKDHAAEFPAVAGSLQNQVIKSNGANPGQFGEFGLTQAQVFSQNTAQIGGVWNLYNGSLAQIQAQEAKRQVESSRFDLRRAEQQLATDVAAAWYNVVQQRVALKLADGDRAYQRELLDAARAQERVGRVAGVDVLRAQVNALRSLATFTSAAAAEQNARESFAQRIGAPDSMQFAFPVDLPEPALPQTPIDGLIAQALASRSDIASERAQVALARLMDQAIESDRLPQLQLNYAFGNAEIPTTQTTSTQFVPGIGYVPGVSVNRVGFWQIGATETFTVPFIEYGARRAQHRAARAQVDAALATLASGESGVAVDVKQDFRAVETAHANLITSREADRLGAESARIAQLQYRNGLISLTDATAAEQSALSAANDLVAARVAYLNALVRLRAAVGVADPVSVVDVGS